MTDSPPVSPSGRCLRGRGQKFFKSLSLVPGALAGDTTGAPQIVKLLRTRVLLSSPVVESVLEIIARWSAGQAMPTQHLQEYTGLSSQFVVLSR